MMLIDNADQDNIRLEEIYLEVIYMKLEPFNRHYSHEFMKNEDDGRIVRLMGSASLKKGDKIIYEDWKENATFNGEIWDIDPTGKIVLVCIHDEQFRIKLRILEQVESDTYMVKRSNQNQSLANFTGLWDEGEAVYVDGVWLNYMCSSVIALVVIWRAIVHDAIACSIVDIEG